MTRTELANLTTADLCAMIGVEVTRAISTAGFIVCRVTCEGDSASMAELRPSRVRPWLIDAAMDFENAGAFA